MSPITRTELADCGVADTYEAVRLLRPGWLSSRVRTRPNQGSDGLPVLYAQNMWYGSAYDLQQFHMADIEEIRYVHPLDATTRWGTGHTDGVIEIIWLKRSKR
jgi:hypothetical protein